MQYRDAFREAGFGDRCPPQDQAATPYRRAETPVEAADRAREEGGYV